MNSQTISKPREDAASALDGVSLCVCLILVTGLPAAKRLPLSHDSDDVLAGSDFLSVFMQRSDRLRTADRPDGPFEPHNYDRDLNSVSHKGALLDLVKPYPQLSEKYTISNIFKSGRYGYGVNDMSSEGEDYQVTTPGVIPTLEVDARTTTQFTEPTTIEDIPTTMTYSFDRITNHSAVDDQQTTISVSDETSTKLETTTQIATEKVEEKVISVRVSSSVARHSHRTIETSTAKSSEEDASEAKQEDENLVSTLKLVTQEQPTITAVQRSEFAVEEASVPDTGASDRQGKEQSAYDGQEEVEGKVEEVSVFANKQQRAFNGKLPVFEIHFHSPPAALLSNYNQNHRNNQERYYKPEIQRSEDAQVPTLRRKEFRQLSQPEPISYQSRVSSPTSDSSVKFYREHPRSSSHVAAETVHQPVVSDPYQQSQDKIESPPDEQKYKDASTYHEEPRERSYAQPEKVYGQPEVNYEVDEAVSVITNGKAHGAQSPTTQPSHNPADPAQNKFGYVVEGRNFRKYRVEERTADGFIVGEYGVVSHDDGSLRGVRYTADSTINPRLIYDTLVKFLSLK